MPICAEVYQCLRSCRVAVFDFDGTLVQSNEIKWRGFEHVFRSFNEHFEEIRTFCRANNHTIRGEKFRYVCEQILQIPYTPALDATLHASYAEFTTTAVMSAPEVPGAEHFLKSLGDLPLALLSSTPHEILKDILSRRGWLGYFRHVRGAPVRKDEWLVALQKDLHCSSSEIVFFGDTIEDAHAAQQAGSTFVCVGSECGADARLRIENFL